MTKKILHQEEEIKKQILVYSEQARIKQEEETELARVLADYKKKYDEFAGAMKKSRKTFKVYEGEIKNLNTRALELATIKRKLLQGENQKKKKGKDDVSVEKKNQELEKMLSDWADEKKALEKEKEELMAQSKTLQDEIKVLNSGKGGAGGV
jgi:chromosome segregation ATPase